MATKNGTKKATKRVSKKAVKRATRSNAARKGVPRGDRQATWFRELNAEEIKSFAKGDKGWVLKTKAGRAYTASTTRACIDAFRKARKSRNKAKK